MLDLLITGGCRIRRSWRFVQVRGLVLVLRLLLSLWRMAWARGYLCEILLEHLLLGWIVLVQNVWIVVHVWAVVCVLIIVVLLQGISTRVIEGAAHPWWDILAASNWHGVVLIKGWSWTEAYHLSIIYISTKVLRLLVNRLVSFIYWNELLLDVLVIRHVLILQLVNIMEDILHLLNVLCLLPQELLRIL